MRSILILITVAAYVGAAETELPRSVERAIQARDETIAEAHADFAKVVEREIERATRAGNADLIMTLRDLLPAAPEAESIAAMVRCRVDGGDPVPIRGLLFDNRQYMLVNVPEFLHDWKVVQQTGGAATSQRFTAEDPCTIFMVSTDPTLAKAGITKREETLAYSDGNRTQVFLYEIAYAGGVFTTPEAAGFLGAALVVPQNVEGR